MINKTKKVEFIQKRTSVVAGWLCRDEGGWISFFSGGEPYFEGGQWETERGRFRLDMSKLNFLEEYNTNTVPGRGKKRFCTIEI